ncbi:MAG: hypothetical protein WCS65_12565 [Verrucomicrobiae bacterium]
MSSYLTWPEARALALAGTPVRRDGWPTLGTETPPAWLERRTGLWVLTGSRHAVMRVADAGWFGSEEFFAKDWTTDAPGTERDVCLVAPPRAAVLRFVPPGIGLTGALVGATLTLSADIGQMSPAGVCGLEFLVNGVSVGFAEAATAGRYSVSVPVEGLAGSGLVLSAMLRVRTSLPLPAWEGIARWEMRLIVADFFAGYLDSGTLFARYAIYDYDSNCFGWGVDEGVGWTVDGHFVFEATGGGQCVIVESTGSYATNAGNTVGTVWKISDVDRMAGAVISNVRRNSDIINPTFNNPDGSAIFGVLSNQVR